MTRMDRLIAGRIAARRAKAEAAALRVLALLRSRGVEVEIVGSLARTGARGGAGGDFDLSSDVDFLVLRCPNPLRYAIEADVEDAMDGLPFDVIYLDEVKSERFREKLLHEAGHAPKAG